MIVTHALTKRYGSILAVDQVDLEVREGDRYGFLGPNGSGKTTVIRMLLGLVYATSGEIEVLGQPVPARSAQVLPQIGSLVEGPAAYGHLSGRANLALLDQSGPGGSRRTRKQRITEALDQVGLGGVDNRAVRKYSLGMRQRLGLAAALLRPPRLLILDEPANGLDPQGIMEIRDLLTGLNEAGITIFLSSHQLSEVEQLCTRVGIIDRGRLVRQQELSELRGPTGRTIVRTPDAGARRRLAERVRGAAGRRPARRRRPGPGSAQRPPGRGRHPGDRDRAGAALTGGNGARGDHPRLRPHWPDRPGRGRGPAMMRAELIKLARRPRTWASLALLCGIPVLVAVFVAVTHLAPPPGQGPALLSAVLSSGSLFPAAALAIVLPIFLPVAVAVMAGDSVAGEASAGTLRYLLVRPAGRTRLLAAKLVAMMVYVLAAVVLIALTAYVTGLLLFGSQPVGVSSSGLTSLAATSLSGSGLTLTQILLRTLGAVAFIAISMLGVGAIALFLSTVTDSSLGAALGALAALVVSEVLVTLNSAAAVSPYLPTRYWLAWADFFRQPILWRSIERGFAVQAVYAAVFLAAAWAHFATKDVTS